MAAMVAVLLAVVVPIALISGCAPEEPSNEELLTEALAWIEAEPTDFSTQYLRHTYGAQGTSWRVSRVAPPKGESLVDLPLGIDGDTYLWQELRDTGEPSGEGPAVRRVWVGASAEEMAGSAQELFDRFGSLGLHAGRVGLVKLFMHPLGLLQVAEAVGEDQHPIGEGESRVVVAEARPAQLLTETDVELLASAEERLGDGFQFTREGYESLLVRLELALDENGAPVGLTVVDDGNGGPVVFEVSRADAPPDLPSDVRPLVVEEQPDGS